MKTPLIATVLILATAVSAYFYPVHSGNPKSELPITKIVPVPEAANVDVKPLDAGLDRPVIEVVFVLDTTGSMSGLIQAAKDKIWSIASSMASANTAPTIKMGLVAYRDRGDAYVTRMVDLSDDLDTTYGTLMSFEADGGGDTPESVNKGLYDAVNNMSWSEDQNTYRVVFLVGDAPPQTSYQDEMQYPEIIKLAQSKGIVVNTIQCGNMASTTKPWQQIAMQGQGQFFQVQQSGGAVAVVTPFDDRMAQLSKELDETRLFYGSKEVKQRKRAKVAATNMFNRSASSSAIARKAEFNVSKSGVDNFVGNNELVANITDGRIKLDDIKENEMPAELQKLDTDQQMVVIKEKSEKRQALRSQIAKLASQRSDYLREEIASTGADKDSIDNKIYQAVKSQASKKGYVYEDETPKY